MRILAAINHAMSLNIFHELVRKSFKYYSISGPVHNLSCILFTLCIIWLRTFFGDISDGITSDATQRAAYRNRSTYIKIKDNV